MPIKASKRSTSSSNAENTANIPQPARQQRVQNALVRSMGNARQDRAPQQCGVREVSFGDSKAYPDGGNRYKLEQRAPIPSLQIVSRGGVLYIELYGVKDGAGKNGKPVVLAGFRFVADGDCILSVHVYRIRQQVDIFELNRKTGKDTQFHSFQLGDDNDVEMRRTKSFWDTMCCELQKLSVAQCRYLNLQRSAATSVVVPTHRYETRYRDNMKESLAQLSQGKEDVLEIPIPHMKRSLVFTKFFAAPAILEGRKRLLQGGTLARKPTKPNPKTHGSGASLATSAVVIPVRTSKRQKQATVNRNARKNGGTSREEVEIDFDE